MSTLLGATDRRILGIFALFFGVFMPVVDIGPVPVGVFDRFVLMPVRVLFIGGLIQMIVVVMLVGMPVRDRKSVVYGKSVL